MLHRHTASQSWIRQFFSKRHRLVALPIVVLLALTSFLALANPTPGGDHPRAVGPISSDNGFPVWYKDGNNLRLELCLDSETAATPLCGFLPGDIPLPDEPLTVPSNFPEEAFWMLGSAGLTTNASGGRAILVLALEAAFSANVANGDQISFGRVRIRASDLVPGGTYKVTHPYGYDIFTNVEGGVKGINFTDDIGIGAPGDFTGALNSRIGPFITWTDFPNSAGLPNLPSGTDAYIGDPAIEHAVKGSPFNTNFFRIEGPAGSFPGSPSQCADIALGASLTATDDCIETSLFSLLGKLATNAGVNASRATYTLDSSGAGAVDVFATSEAGQSIQVFKGGSYGTTTMAGDSGGRYYTRIDFRDVAPTLVRVRNVSDSPISFKDILVTDKVSISKAEYNTATKQLTIQARSSDALNSPTLTVSDGLGAFNGGTLVVDGVAIAPDQITVTSAKGGSDTAGVEIVGPGAAPDPVVAGIAVPNGLAMTPTPPDTTLTFNVQQGQTVTLDGSSTAGDVTGFQWQQIGGAPAVALSGAATATASFVAPTQVTTLVFRLTATRQTPSASDTKDVTIKVLQAQPPVANAGPDQVVARGASVTLDGSASTNASTYTWTQTAGQAVTLTGASTARPTFQFPAGFSGTLTFNLTVSSQAGSSSDTVSISPLADALTLARAQYTRSKNEWRFDGTAAILGAPAGPGNTITVTLNKTVGATTTSVVLGTAAVDSLGAWTLRFTTTDPAKQPTAAGTTYRVSITSSRGGALPNQAVTVK